jgi:hypothetical protein
MASIATRILIRDLVEKASKWNALFICRKLVDCAAKCRFARGVPSYRAIGYEFGVSEAAFCLKRKRLWGQVKGHLLGAAPTECAQARGGPEQCSGQSSTNATGQDAPALGFFLIACYAVLRAEEGSQRSSGRWIAMAGIAAGLSASCKITLLAGGSGLFLYILWSFNWKRAAWFVFSAALTGCLIYGWIILRDGFPAVFLNFEVLAKFPMSRRLTLVSTYLKDYGVVILATLALIRPPTHEAANSKAPPAIQMVWLLLFISLLVMPVSIASVAKYGGDVNSRAIFALPLTLAAIFAMWATIRANLLGRLTASATALTGAILIVTIDVPSELKRMNFGRSVMEESYATVRAYPSKCYFPYDPLAHLLAGDRFRPNMDVIYSYAVAGFPVNQTAFESSMPEEMKYVIYPSSVMKDWGLSEIRRLLPAQSVPTKSLNLALQEVWGRGITKADAENGKQLSMSVASGL